MHGMGGATPGTASFPRHIPGLTRKVTEEEALHAWAQQGGRRSHTPCTHAFGYHKQTPLLATACLGRLCAARKVENGTCGVQAGRVCADWGRNAGPGHGGRREGLTWMCGGDEEQLWPHCVCRAFLTAPHHNLETTPNRLTGLYLATQSGVCGTRRPRARVCGGMAQHSGAGRCRP